MTLILFASLLVALVIAQVQPTALVLPAPLCTVCVAIVGARAGSTVDRAVATTVLDSPWLVCFGVVATVVVSMAAGQLMRLGKGVSGVTASFCSVPGLASGIGMMSRDFGADAPTVLTVQYLRLLAVALSVPVIAPLLGVGLGGHREVGEGWWVHGAAFTVAVVGAGLAASHWLPIPGGQIAYPVTIAAGIELTGLLPHLTVPSPLLAIAYAGVGYIVGNELTRDRLRALARLLPLALAQSVVGIAGCAAVGVAFARASGISLVDGYLATTPGGIPAVAAVAIQIGDDVGFVLAMQVMRLFVALGIAILIGSRYQRHLSLESTTQ